MIRVSSSTATRAGVLAHVDHVVQQEPASLTPIRGGSEAAVRFMETVPTDLRIRPIRVYASLQVAPTMEQRVDLAIRELDRTGAFHRGTLLVVAPTGAGHVNPVALELMERLTGGDIASVAVQFGMLPSALSINKVDDERAMLYLLLRRIRARIQQLYPHGGGPKVVLYGESLGGWASQGALDAAADEAQRATGRITDPMRELGIDTAVWVGVPGFSRFRSDRLGTGSLQTVSGTAQLAALSPEQRRTTRAWNLSHLDDPVHLADLATIWRRPTWLPADGHNPQGVPTDARWRPVMTFLNTIQRVVTTANETQPGVFTGAGHDYRADLPQLLRAALKLDRRISNARLAQITEQVRRSEVWIMSQRWG